MSAIKGVDSIMELLHCSCVSQDSQKHTEIKQQRWVDNSENGGDDDVKIDEKTE